MNLFKDKNAHLKPLLHCLNKQLKTQTFRSTCPNSIKEKWKRTKSKGQKNNKEITQVISKKFSMIMAACFQQIIALVLLQLLKKNSRKRLKLSKHHQTSKRIIFTKTRPITNSESKILGPWKNSKNPTVSK